MTKAMRALPVLFFLLALLVAGPLLQLLPMDWLSRETASEEAAPNSDKAAAKKPVKADATVARLVSPSGEATQEAGAKPDATGGASKAEFDIARVDPQGTSVFAGRAEPGDTVTVLADGKPVATTKADDNGEWTMAVEGKVPSKDAELALSTNPELAVIEEKQEAGPEHRMAAAAAGGSDAPSAGGKPASAKDVTKSMIKDLQGLVDEARKEAEPKAPAAVAPAAPATADAGGTTPAGEQAVASWQKEEAASPEAAAPASAPAETGAPPAASGTAAAKEPEKPVATADASTFAAPAAVAPTEQSRAEGASPSASASTTATATVTAAAEPAPSQPNPAARSGTARRVPVPIMFVFREANFTPEGEEAVKLLLEYLKLKRFDKVTLTGHADERGSPDLNMDLSRERLAAVATYLKEGGFSGALDLEPKGESEPYMGVDRTQYSIDDLFQLDRRVELSLPQ